MTAIGMTAREFGTETTTIEGSLHTAKEFGFDVCLRLSSGKSLFGSVARLSNEIVTIESRDERTVDYKNLDAIKEEVRVVTAVRLSAIETVEVRFG